MREEETLVIVQFFDLISGEYIPSGITENDVE